MGNGILVDANAVAEKQAVKASNALYAVICELHDVRRISYPAFMLAKSALMVIESIIAPSYAMFETNQTMTATERAFLRWQDDEDVPF